MAGLKHKNAFKKYPEYADAIMALYPEGAPFAISGNDYSTLQWYSPKPAPSENEIKDKLDELMTEWNNELYKWERYKKYLTVEEQLAQLWDDMKSGRIPGKETSEWFSNIQSIKEEHPKPTN